jgi:hypothetical protein
MQRPRHFLMLWAVALLTMLLLVAAFNAVINPYDVFGWPRIQGVNEYKPGTKNHVALAKALQVIRARPVTVILGTSRAYLAMDAASPEWPESYRPVYNYGTPESNMSEVLFRELRQAWSAGRLRHAVAILDVPAFLDPDRPAPFDESGRRLAYLDDGQVNPYRHRQYLRDAFLSLFTMGALADSARTVLERHGGDTVLDLRPDGTATEAIFLDTARAEGMNALFADKDEDDLKRVPGFQSVLRDWHGPMPNIGLLRDMIQFCLAHDVGLTLILGASHVDEMELYRLAGLWPYVEKLKRDLAQLVADAHSDRITAWDFVEYAPYTTEHVPQAGDRATRMRWFWEPVHFQRALGEVMLRRVFSGTPDDFGAKLTLATVDARNQQVREQQRGFIGWRLACEDNRLTRCIPPGRPKQEVSR